MEKEKEEKVLSRFHFRWSVYLKWIVEEKRGASMFVWKITHNLLHSINDES